MTSASKDPPAIAGFDHVRLLGSGRFADVHLYEQRFPRRLVAVKVIEEKLLTWEAEHAFELEANALAALSSHPCIVAIYDAGRSADGHPYIVMEYCPLRTLADQVLDRPVGVEEALRIGILLAGAVETAHAHGIVHRDIKPANVLMTDYGAPKLSDFGIASSSWDRNAVSGFTPAWAPPELMAGAVDATQATDVYSLAATLYTLLAGHAPHLRPGEDNGLGAILDRATTEPVPDLPEDVPPAVRSVLARALARDPAGRFGSARELGVALQRAQEELGLTTTAMTLVAPEMADPRHSPDGDAGSTLPDDKAGVREPSGTGVPGSRRGRRRRRRAVLAVVAIAVVAALTVAGVSIDRPSGAPETDEGQLDLDLPFQNLGCTGEWIVVLGIALEESSWAPKLRSVSEGVPSAKYLRNRDSCEVFTTSNHGVDIYEAYTGPYDSLQWACKAKLTYARPVAAIRRLSPEATQHELCLCLDAISEVPVLDPGTGSPFPVDKRLVSELQYVFLVEGLNPDERLSGHHTREFVDMIEQYQSRHRLPVTGELDPATWQLLHEAYCNG